MATIATTSSSVSTLITDAAYAAGVLGQDQTILSGDQNLFLRVLQRMLDSWSNEKQMIFLNDVESFTMTAGTQVYSTALLPNGRPVAITSLRLSLSGIDYPCEPMDQNEWNDIAVKSVSSIPSRYYYDDAYPNASMFFYPVPYANFTVNMYCQRQLQGGITMTSTLDMPLGYEQAVVDGLAVAISPFYGKQATPQMIAQMKQSRSVLKRTNYQPLEMSTPFDDTGDISNAFPYRGF